MEGLERANVIDFFEKDEMCPFCYKKPIGHATDKPEEVDDEVTSKPKSLGCDTSSWRGNKAPKRESGKLPYTLAQHHLISAMQCYGRIRRLVRMGNMVGYDINNENNGIGLPTTYKDLKYPEDGMKKKYGDLDDKQSVAFALMKELGAQWHVGHHSFTVVVRKSAIDSWKEGGADERNTDDRPHESKYDEEIITLLFDLIKSYPKSFCEEEKRDEKFKEDMNEISAWIKERLEKFNGKNGAKPAESDPLFVSRLAHIYSGIADNPPNADLQSNNVSL
jgi:hypothetical protein